MTGQAHYGCTLTMSCFFRTKENHIKSNRELTCWCGFCNVIQRLKFVLQNNLMRFSAFGPLA